MIKKVYKQECFALSYLRIQAGKMWQGIWLLLKDKIGWGMKNFNILGVHGKIRVLGGSHEKPIYRAGLPKMGGLGQFADLMGEGGLAGKEEGVMFLSGGLLPQCTLWTCQFLSVIVLRSGRVLLYITVSGKCTVLDVLILFLRIEIARLICVVVSVLF